MSAVKLRKIDLDNTPKKSFRMFRRGQNSQVVPEYRLTLSFPRKLESSFLYIIDLEIPAFAGMTDLGAFY